MAAEVAIAEQRDALALRRLFAQLRAHLETRNYAGRVGQVFLGFGVAYVAKHSFCSATCIRRNDSGGGGSGGGCSRGGSFSLGERNSVRYGSGLCTVRANMTAVASFVEEDRTSTTSRRLASKEAFLKTTHYSARAGQKYFPLAKVALSAVPARNRPT